MPITPFTIAKWIWPESHNSDLHNSYALFRKAFDVTVVPGKSPLFITADQSYQLYINGHYVCRGPARGFQHHWPYDEVDVARWLKPGPNLIAVRAHHPGFSNFQYLTQGYAGLLVAAHWGKVRLVSDQTWKCRRQTGVRRDTMPTSHQLFCQEHIDLRREDPEWSQSDYDDSAWPQNACASVWNAMPWYALEERGIPMLKEEVASQGPRIIGQQSKRNAAGYRVARDAARLRLGEGLRHKPIPPESGEIRVHRTKPGRFQSYLLDFGCTVVGSVGFEINGAGGGEILDTLHVETIDLATLTPDFVPEANSRMAFAHRLTCRPGSQTHFFYHAFGFRYMVLTIRGATGGLKVRPLLRTTLYPLEPLGSFLCADAEVQGIWDTCARTQRVCSLDAYVDTPWREQAQWWGDARIQAKNTFFLSGDTRLFRRGIRQIASQRVPNGLTYGHAPTMAHNCILPDFSLVWLLTLWDYYWQTGSTEPFETHQDTVASVLSYFKTVADPATGLVRHDPRYWLFLDWADLHRTGAPTILNLWLVLALERMAQLHRVVGRHAEAARTDRWRCGLIAALQKLVGGDGLVKDGYDEKGRLVKTVSIHGQILALTAGLPGMNKRRVLDKIVLPYLSGEKSMSAEPSAYWITYIFELLREEGYGEEVIEFIRSRWTPMTAHGTTWENYAPKRGDESFSHAWSAHPLHHLMQICGGIVQTAPGWRTMRFQPYFVISSCETRVPVPQGIIASSWQIVDGRIAVHLELPRGMEAEVCLPGAAPTIIRKSQLWNLLADSP